MNLYIYSHIRKLFFLLLDAYIVYYTIFVFLQIFHVLLIFRPLSVKFLPRRKDSFLGFSTIPIYRNK